MSYQWINGGVTKTRQVWNFFGYFKNACILVHNIAVLIFKETFMISHPSLSFQEPLRSSEMHHINPMALQHLVLPGWEAGSTWLELVFCTWSKVVDYEHTYMSLIQSSIVTYFMAEWYPIVRPNPTVNLVKVVFNIPILETMLGYHSCN